MAIIGGRVGRKKTNAHSHRITVINDQNERSDVLFYTLRSARNYLREHARVTVVELVDLATGTVLTFN